jgi:hypothetical protein
MLNAGQHQRYPIILIQKWRCRDTACPRRQRLCVMCEGFLGYQRKRIMLSLLPA